MLATIATPIGPSLRVGDGEPVRIMALVGSTRSADERAEQSKIERLAEYPHPPHVVADVSIRLTNFPLWRRILMAGLPAATLPVYTARGQNGRIDRAALLDRAVEQLESGVGMITIHPTARNDIIDLARRRKIPWTSRGGGLIIKDMLGRSLTQNAYLDILPDLSAAARARGATISIGATFRSATVIEADDEAQREEIAFQADLAAQLLRDGCSVIVEGPGHAMPTAIRGLAERMRKTGCPIMPLGPIPTDSAVGQDHISAAIGATLMGLEGAAHILAAVTREEHTGGVPHIASTLEAIEAARVAALVIDLHRLGPGPEDLSIQGERSGHRTCVAGRIPHGCERCGDTCPL